MLLSECVEPPGGGPRNGAALVVTTPWSVNATPKDRTMNQPDTTPPVCLTHPNQHPPPSDQRDTAHRFLTANDLPNAVIFPLTDPDGKVWTIDGRPPKNDHSNLHPLYKGPNTPRICDCHEDWENATGWGIVLKNLPLLVIDIDHIEEFPDDDTLLTALVETSTLRYRTGRGYHFWYKWDPADGKISITEVPWGEIYANTSRYMAGPGSANKDLPNALAITTEPPPQLDQLLTPAPPKTNHILDDLYAEAAHKDPSIQKHLPKMRTLLQQTGARPPKTGQGNWHCGQPAHKRGDRNPSLSVNLHKRVFHCFACGWEGDQVSLAADQANQPVDEYLRDIRKKTTPPKTAPTPETDSGDDPEGRYAAPPQGPFTLGERYTYGTAILKGDTIVDHLKPSKPPLTSQTYARKGYQEYVDFYNEHSRLAAPPFQTIPPQEIKKYIENLPPELVLGDYGLSVAIGPPGDQTLLYGPTNTGKSWVALYLLAQTGQPSLYIATEQNTGIAQRLADHPQECAKIHLATQPQSGADIKTLTDHCQKHNIQNIVLDCLSPLMMEENSVADYHAAINFLAPLAADRRLIIVHHEGKNQLAGARGTSRIQDQPTRVYRITHPKDTPHGTIEIRPTKRKDDRGPGGYLHIHPAETPPWIGADILDAAHTAQIGETDLTDLWSAWINQHGTNSLPFTQIWPLIQMIPPNPSQRVAKQTAHHLIDSGILPDSGKASRRGTPMYFPPKQGGTAQSYNRDDTPY